MDEKRIYKLSLLMPVALPLIFWLVMPRDSSSLPDWIATVLMTGILSAVIGGIPYAIVAILLLIWMWNEDARSIRKILIFSPIFMLVAFIPCLVAFLIFSADTSLTASSVTGFGYLVLIFSGYILVIGYFYVFLTLAIARTFRKKPIENLPE